MKVKALMTAVLMMMVTSVTWAAEHTVKMKNMGADGSMVFEPAVLKVAVGDTVHFEPTDPAHNSESVTGLVPQGGATWKGGMNQKVSVTLDKEGVYVYKCAPHSIMAMVGVIVAGNPVNLEQVKADSASFQASFMLNKDRLQKYLDQVN